jgi:ankyrin repeat protein
VSLPVWASDWEGVDGALRSAAFDGDLGRVEKALDAGASIDSQSEPDRPTALMYAASNGHGTVAELLLARGANPNARTESGMSALAFAIEKGHPDTALLLLKHGAEPRQRDGFGVSPLGCVSK